MEVFIGTGASLEDRRAAQNQRRALCNASAAASASTAAVASAGGDVEDEDDDVELQVVTVSIAGGTLPPAGGRTLSLHSIAPIQPLAPLLLLA